MKRNTFIDIRQQMIGNTERVDRAFQWLKAYRPGRSPSFLLITGLTGTGKTLLWSTIVPLFGYQWIEISPMQHTINTITNALQNYTGLQRTISGQWFRGVVVIDDLDLVFNSPQLFWRVQALLRQTDIPKIIVSNRTHSKAIQALLRGVESVDLLRTDLQPVSVADITTLLRSRTSKHYPAAAPLPLLEYIARHCGGDIRHAQIVQDQRWATEQHVRFAAKDEVRGACADHAARIFRPPALSLTACLDLVAQMGGGYTKKVWNEYLANFGSNKSSKLLTLSRLNELQQVAEGFATADLVSASWSINNYTPELGDYTTCCGLWNLSITKFPSPLVVRPTIAPLPLKWVKGCEVARRRRKQKPHLQPKHPVARQFSQLSMDRFLLH